MTAERPAGSTSGAGGGRRSFFRRIRGWLAAGELLAAVVLFVALRIDLRRQADDPRRAP